MNADDTATTQWRTLESAERSGEVFSGSTSRAVDRAEEVGSRLQQTFARVLRSLPARVVKIADIVRWLHLDRSICQRVVMGVRDAKDGLGVLERIPGVRGLEQFVDAAERRGCPKPVAAEARTAIETYAQLVNAAGGSQTRLVDRIGELRATSIPQDRSVPSEEEMLRSRRKCFEGAVGLTGATSRSRVEIVMIGPAPDSRGTDDRVTTASATAMIGVELGPHAMPLTRRSRLAGLTPVPAAAQDGSARSASGLLPQLLLHPFTSDPPPRVTARTVGEWLIQIFENEGAGGAPLDIVAGMAFNWTWGTPAPQEGDSNFYSVGRIIGPPTRTLVFDFYLHRGLPAPKSIGAHVLRPSTQGSLGNARPQSRWYDRVPQEHDLVLLGGVPGSRPSAAYPRVGELTRHLASTMGWQDIEFTGYRFEVEYPIYDFEYVIAAEF